MKQRVVSVLARTPSGAYTRVLLACGHEATPFGGWECRYWAQPKAVECWRCLAAELGLEPIEVRR